MLVWVVGKDGLMGQSVCNTLGLPLIGSCRIEVDVRSKQMLEVFYQKHKPSHIVNCSAYVQVDQTEGALAKDAYNVNVVGTMNLALLAKTYDLKMVHLSTDYVFDGEKETDYTERDRTNPINVYGKTKLEGEQEAKAELPTVTILRTASLFGPYKRGLIDSMVDMLIGEESCSFVSDQISTPTHVDDVTSAIRCILDEEGIFHFVNGGHCSRFELLEFLRDLLHKYKIPVKCKELIKVVQKDFSRPAKRPHRSVLSTKKIERHLDFTIRSWQEAVEAFFVSKWVRRNG